MSRWRTMMLGGIVTLVTHLLLAVGSPAGDEVTELAEQGRESLRRLGEVPWYDPSDDSVRPLKESADWNWSWSGLPIIGVVLRVMALTVLAAIFLLLVIVLILYMQGRELPFWKFAERKEAAEVIASLAERLPVPLESSVIDFLEHARQLYQEQRFSEAIVYFFCYQLIELDRQQFIRLVCGKTNRQYLRELRPHAQLKPLVERTMIAFEDAFFGKHPMGRERFEECWRQLPEFEQLTQQSVASVT